MGQTLPLRYQALVAMVMVAMVWFFLWLVVLLLRNKKIQKESEKEKVSKGI